MNSKTYFLNETVSLMALGSGIWEYFNITCMEDLKEAYKDFDERVAFGGDIELQYIDGCLSGYSCDCFSDVLEMVEEYNLDIEIVKDILNAVGNVEEAKRIIENENYAYYNGTSERDVFENYLIETDFYYDIPENKHHFIDVEKVRNDYYFIDIYKTDELEKYLFIFN